MPSRNRRGPRPGTARARRRTVAEPRPAGASSSAGHDWRYCSNWSSTIRSFLPAGKPLPCRSRRKASGRSSSSSGPAPGSGAAAVARARLRSPGRWRRPMTETVRTELLQPGQDPGVDQRALAAAGGPEDQPNSERRLTVGRLDPRLPEPNDLGQVRRGPSGRASARGKTTRPRGRTTAALWGRPWPAGQPRACGSSSHRLSPASSASSSGHRPGRPRSGSGRSSVSTGISDRSAPAHAVRLHRAAAAALPRGKRSPRRLARGRCAPPNGRPPCQELVEDDPQCPDVGPAVEPVCLATDLLGCHVRDRPGQLSRPSRLGRLMHGQPKVGHMRLTLAVDQDVRRLDIAMHELLGVRVVQRIGHLDDQPGGPVRRDAAPPSIIPRSVDPSMYSITTKIVPSSSVTTSWTVTIAGCRSCAAFLASARDASAVAGGPLHRRGEA